MESRQVFYKTRLDEAPSTKIRIDERVWQEIKKGSVDPDEHINHILSLEKDILVNEHVKRKSYEKDDRPKFMQKTTKFTKMAINQYEFIKTKLKPFFCNT